jgi:hypothetical protein
MIGITARVSGDAQAARELDRLGRALGNDALETTRIVGRSVALFGMRESYPRGVGGKAKLGGEHAIERDARKILAVSASGVSSSSAAFSHQEALRGARGTIAGKRKKRSEDPRVMWATAEAIREAITRRQLMVGWAKAAWAKAGVDLGAKAPQKWITRHAAAPGYATATKKLSGPVVTMGSRTSYASNIFSAALQARAIRQGTKNAIAWMQRQADKETGKTTKLFKR